MHVTLSAHMPSAEGWAMIGLSLLGLASMSVATLGMLLSRQRPNSTATPISVISCENVEQLRLK
jgi:hypothetical protein